jgi:hypothetical protein
MSAPAGWTADMQYACHAHAEKIVKAFQTIDQHFPDYVFSDYHLTLFAYEAIRNQLQYLRVCVTIGAPLYGQALAEATKGFSIMYDVLARMTKYFATVKSVVRIDLV